MRSAHESVSFLPSWAAFTMLAQQGGYPPQDFAKGSDWVGNCTRGHQTSSKPLVLPRFQRLGPVLLFSCSPHSAGGVQFALDTQLPVPQRKEGVG